MKMFEILAATAQALQSIEQWLRVSASMRSLPSSWSISIFHEWVAVKSHVSWAHAVSTWSRPAALLRTCWLTVLSLFIVIVNLLGCGEARATTSF